MRKTLLLLFLKIVIFADKKSGTFFILIFQSYKIRADRIIRLFSANLLFFFCWADYGSCIHLPPQFFCYYIRFEFFKFWSNTGQILIKYWSNVGQLGLQRHYILVKICSNTDKTLIKYWSNVGKTGIERHQILVKFWSNTVQILIEYWSNMTLSVKEICKKRNLTWKNAPSW